MGALRLPEISGIAYDVRKHRTGVREVRRTEVDFSISISRWELAERPQCQSNCDGIRNGLPAGKIAIHLAMTGLKQLWEVQSARRAGSRARACTGTHTRALAA